MDTQGDAFFVAFAGAKQAVLCALDIQRALAGHDWPAGAPSVTVIHRRDTLRASKIMQERAFANPKITFLWNSEVAKVLGQDKVTACGSAAPRTAPSRCCR